MSWAILGVDPSSKKLAGVASPLDGSDPTLWLVTLPDKAPIEVRCQQARKAARAVVRRIIRMYGVDHVGVFMEAPLVGRGGVKTTVLQSKVQGAALAGYIDGGAEWAREANASRTKKLVIGKGNADKDEIMLWVEESYPDIFEMIEGDQDLADACMHWHAGLDIARKAKL
ncbi:RuvC-like resolvase [Gordonia phage DalanDe]|nr:RuvC-like resolvase [Gordonia phage DalanDe]